MRTEWNTFTPGVWQREINVRDFIQKNYTPYDGDDAFLEGPTKNTEDLWAQVMELSAKEREAGGAGYGYESHFHYYVSWTRIPE